MNSFTWSSKDAVWVVTVDLYKKEFKNCRGPIHNGKLCSQTIEKKRNKDKNAPSIQALPSLMVFLGEETHQFTPRSTGINVLIILSGMRCGIYSPCQNLWTKRRSGIFYFISLDYPWTKWNNGSISFRKDIICINTWFRTWCGQECTWGSLCLIIFFREYLHWFYWHQLYLRYMFPPRVHLFLIHTILYPI